MPEADVSVAIDQAGFAVDIDLGEPEFIIIDDAILRCHDFASVFIDETVETVYANGGPAILDWLAWLWRFLFGGAGSAPVEEKKPAQGSRGERDRSRDSRPERHGRDRDRPARHAGCDPRGVVRATEPL